ncbi:hypothetical protein BKI52_14610 [marine bacterium AO1-C]|nr:hypothetical protein BKI52_14610 [marine bacterium AO1-C]
MDIGTVKFVRPQNEFLQKYIKGYYMHRSTDPAFEKTVYFYQNITSTINIYQDTQVKLHDNFWTYHHAPNTGFNARMVVKIKGYQEVKLRGKFDKVAIVFYPTGINHFIRCPLSELVHSIYSVFTHFDGIYDAILPALFAAPTIEQKRDILDNFFVSQFQAFPDERLLAAAEKIITSEQPIKVNELAESLGVSRRTLLRLFQKHLIYSVEEYQAIVKFRRALIELQQQGKAHLTSVAYNSAYYDQADFNHQFKHRSGLTPSELFDQLNIVDNTLFWNLK